MKSNAIIRIVCYSLVLVILGGILAGALVFRGRWRWSEERLIPAIRTQSGRTTGSAPLMAAPSPGSEIRSNLEPDTQVKITEEINVEGNLWVHIVSPQEGWLPKENVEEVLPSISEVSMAGGQVQTVPGDKVREIEIEWVAGTILIQPADVSDIQIAESNVSDTDHALHLSVRSSSLHIEFCQHESHSILNFSLGSELRKDLTIYVPRDFVLDALEVDAASANLDIRDMTIAEVDIDSASGESRFENCALGQLDLDSASGDVYFEGTLNTLDCDAVSASITAVLANVPARMDLDSVSGDLDISLPEDAGFTASIDSMSSDFSSEFETTMRNGSHVCGDGACRISVDGMSGDLIIRKTVHHHSDACTTNPDTCPEPAIHHHTEQCQTDPASCPDSPAHHTEAHHN